MHVNIVANLGRRPHPDTHCFGFLLPCNHVPCRAGFALPGCFALVVVPRALGLPRFSGRHLGGHLGPPSRGTGVAKAPCLGPQHSA